MKGIEIMRQSVHQPFLSRYFERNAEQRYLMQLLEFMLWRRGKMLLPAHRERILQEFLQEEFENFFGKDIFMLPQLQVLVTTRCSLRCKNCNAYIPYFGNAGRCSHRELSPEDFQRDMERLASAVTGIRRFILIGGEPLMHPKLARLIDLAVASPLVSVVEIITNGTLVPHQDVLDVVERHREHVYFHISNYAANGALAPRLKHEALFATFRERGIKYQMAEAPVWHKEIPFIGRLDDAAVRAMFASCWIKRCVQIFDGRIAVCPKASSGYELGMIENAPEETVDLRSEGDLRQQLVAFYQRDFFDACRACARIDEDVLVAEQV